MTSQTGPKLPLDSGFRRNDDCARPSDAGRRMVGWQPSSVNRMGGAASKPQGEGL